MVYPDERVIEHFQSVFVWARHFSSLWDLLAYSRIYLELLLHFLLFRGLKLHACGRLPLQPVHPWMGVHAQLALVFMGSVRHHDQFLRPQPSLLRLPVSHLTLLVGIRCPDCCDRCLLCWEDLSSVKDACTACSSLLRRSSRRHVLWVLEPLRRHPWSSASRDHGWRKLPMGFWPNLDS